MGRPVASDTDPGIGPVKPPKQGDERSPASATGAAPTSPDEGKYDAAWTARVLNSMAAWGRRERGLVRGSDSAGRGYVAYDATARPASATAEKHTDLGSVEVAESLQREQERQRAERTATTIVIGRQRWPWRWLVAACLTAMATIFPIWANRPTARSQATAHPAVALPRSPQPEMVGPRVPSEATATAAAAPVLSAQDSQASTAAPVAISDRPRSPVAIPKQEPMVRSRAPQTSAPTPRIGVDGGPHEFVDVVTRY
jgi:hypothetical protein